MQAHRLHFLYKKCLFCVIIINYPSLQYSDYEKAFDTTIILKFFNGMLV